MKTHKNNIAVAKYHSGWAPMIKRCIEEYMEEQSVTKPPTKKVLAELLCIKQETLEHWLETYPDIVEAWYTGKSKEEIERIKEWKLSRFGVNNPNSKYNGEYTDELILNYCLLGARNEDLCKYFDINITTLDDWFKLYPTSREACLRGRDEADAKVARSLYNRATGFTVKKAIHAVFQGEITDIQEVDEVVIPDVNAAKYWLSVRQKKTWQEGNAQQINIGIGVDGLGSAILESENFRKLASSLLAQGMIEPTRGNAKIEEENIIEVEVEEGNTDGEKE